MKNSLEQGKLGLRDCIAILVGGMIGSAIYSLSGLTMNFAGPAVIITWAVAGAILLMYGLIVAELSVRFPKSGGVFVFPAKSLGKNEQQGRIWGWFSAWGYLNANIVAIAFSAIYVGTYLGAGFPIFAGEKMQIILALVAIAFVTFLNLQKISITGKANTILVSGLVISMLIYVVIAFASGQMESSNFIPFFGQGILGKTGFIQAIPNAMVAYGSVVAIAFMVGEVKNPNRTVPKAVLISMSVVVSLYLLCIIATVGLVTVKTLQDMNLIFAPFVAAIITKLQSTPWLIQVISISAVLALLTTMLVVMAINARSLAAIADDQLIPSVFAKRGNKSGTPYVATLTIALISGIVSCFPQFTATIVNLGSLFAAITIVINIISLLVARKKFGFENLPYKAPGGTAMPVIAIILIVASYIPGIIQGGWLLWAFTGGWYLLGALILLYGIKVGYKTSGIRDEV